MKNKMQKYLILLFILFGFLLVTRFVYAAKDRTIDYMPRDQEVEMVHKSYSPAIALSEVTLGSCLTDLEDINTRLSRCNHCVGELQALCPDCCLDLTDVNDRKTIRHDFDYDVTQHPMVFDTEACDVVGDCDYPPEAYPDPNYAAFQAYCNSSSIPECQVKGCSNGQPNPQGEGHQCQAAVDGLGNPTGDFICDQDNVDSIEGCTPISGSGVVDCNEIDPKYVITPVPCPDGFDDGNNGNDDNNGNDGDNGNDGNNGNPGNPGNPGGGTCYNYHPTSDLIECIANCQNKTNEAELAAKNLDCGNQDSNICSDLEGSERPGYQNNCPNDEACQERVDWPECQSTTTDPAFCCDDLTAANCVDLTKQLQNVIDQMAQGSAQRCFDYIDPNFVYDFVAKSNEKIMVIWQIQTTPEYTPTTGAAPNSHFYTMVKVFDITEGDPGTEVYPGDFTNTVINQRSFTAAFTVFAAIGTDKYGDPAKSIFQQGHKYRVRLFYLLAPLSDYTLSSKVSDLQFIITRVRE